LKEKVNFVFETANLEPWGFGF